MEGCRLTFASDQLNKEYATRKKFFLAIFPRPKPSLLEHFAVKAAENSNSNLERLTVRLGFCTVDPNRTVSLSKFSFSSFCIC